MKTPQRLVEEYGGWMALVFAFIVSCFTNPDKYHYSELIHGFPAIGLGIFGFMLTFIAIILQSSNKTIDFMKSQTELFKCFINYNRRVVYTSALLTLYAYLVSSFKIPFDSVICGYSVHQFLKVFAISSFWGLLAKLGVDTFYFIKVFYILLRK